MRASTRGPSAATAPVKPGAAPHQSMPERVAELLAGMAQAAAPGDRLGSKEELRARAGVSVGTFNEAVRIAQSRGLVTSRPGPGGGLFVGDPPAMVRLGNSVLRLDSDEASVADAVRIRNALDPLMVDDALWHASPADIADMKGILERMAAAVEGSDPTAFVRANWALHARIADTSPNLLLKSIYSSLLDLIESHTLSVLPVREQPLPEYIVHRHQVHCDLVEAIGRRDRQEALRLTEEHNFADKLSPESSAPPVMDAL